jgi:hypothetical protein
MIMRTPSTLLLSVILIGMLTLTGACSQDQKATNSVAQPVASQPTQFASAELTPEQLGALGAQIRKTPERAADLLRERGLTEQTFEAQIRKTTENPDASKRYAAAYRQGEK